MAILVEGFTLVFRLEAIDAGYPGGWDGFCADRINERLCFDEQLAGVACGSRAELRAYLGRLVERGWAEAGTILATTGLSRRLRVDGRVGPPKRGGKRMAVLVEGLTLVVRAEAIEHGCPLGWSAFRVAARFGGVARSGGLVSVSGMDRERLRLCLAGLGAIGLDEAWTLLATTERPKWIETSIAEAARRQAQAGTTELALVHRLQAVRPEWVAVSDVRVRGWAQIGAAHEPGEAPGEIAVPAGWVPRGARRRGRSPAVAHPAIRALAEPLTPRGVPPMFYIDERHLRGR